MGDAGHRGGVSSFPGDIGIHLRIDETCLSKYLLLTHNSKWTEGITDVYE